MKEKKDIKEIVHLKIHEKTGEKGGSIIRVVSWNIDGRETKKKLEKREFVIGPNGFHRWGKCVGFLLEDLNILTDKWDDIAAVMEGKSYAKTSNEPF